MRVVPFIETIGSEKFKTFLNQSFSVDMLNSEEKIFDGWRRKDMGGWYKFTNDSRVVLEFYPQHYNIVGTMSTIPYPKTLNDFINDMYRYNVQLYWCDRMLDFLEPKDFLHKNEIKNYFVELLKKMGKSHELL
jgi:hypothetical protein